MTLSPDLKSLERDAFRKFYEDGLVDGFFGFVLIGWAGGAVVSDWLSNEWAGTLSVAAVSFALAVVLLVARRHLLLSRLGAFRPGPERRRKISAVRLALLGSVLAGVVVCVAATVVYSQDSPTASFELAMSVLWFLNSVLVLGAMAYFLDVPRFFVYGVLFGLVLPCLVWAKVLWGVRLAAWAVLGSVGAVIVAVGLWKLSRFIRQFPPLAREQEVRRAGR
jgi:hypothetical protein